MTLIEIAIVLIVVGLLLGGVLKGQELINNAKVRTLAEQQNSIKVAWQSFIDRFGAYPGDYIDAQRNIKGAGPAQGTTGDGIISISESPMAFQQLVGAGYLRCSECSESALAAPSVENSPQNAYGGILAVFTDSATYAAIGGPAASPRLLIHTGPRIPSNILAEMDKKIDDGAANTGDFFFSNYDATTGGDPIPGECMTASKVEQTGGSLNAGSAIYYRHADADPEIELNCGGALAI